MSKRLLLAQVLWRFGGGLIGGWLNRESIFIYCYHRVASGDGPVATKFDAGVFGPSPHQLKQHLQFLQEHTTILSESDLIRVIAGESLGKGPYSMVTFDDGYIDNYTLAMPILAELGVPAIFFVPTSFIEERNIGWWDQITYIINNSEKAEIDFRGEKIRLRDREQIVIRDQLEVMKLAPHEQTVDLVMELAEAADSDAPSTDLMDQELMTWGQLREAHEAGITIGSHTCSHWVLATLDADKQSEEITRSKSRIEEKLGIAVHSLAFPVGGPEHFNRTSLKLAEQAGYQLAFSCHTGVANSAKVNPYAIPRSSVPSDLESFKAMFSFPTLMDHNAAKKREF